MTEPHRNPSSTPPPVTEEMIEAVDYVVKMARQYEAAVIRVPDAVHGSGERLNQAKRELFALAARSNQEATRPDVEAIIAELIDLKKGWVTSESFSKFIDRVVGVIRSLEATRTVGDAIFDYLQTEFDWDDVLARKVADDINALSRTSSCGGI